MFVDGVTEWDWVVASPCCFKQNKDNQLYKTRQGISEHKQGAYLVFFLETIRTTMLLNIYTFVLEFCTWKCIHSTKWKVSSSKFVTGLKWVQNSSLKFKLLTCDNCRGSAPPIDACYRNVRQCDEQVRFPWLIIALRSRRKRWHTSYMHRRRLSAPLYKCMLPQTWLQYVQPQMTEL